MCSAIRADDLDDLKKILDGKRARKMVQRTKIWKEERGAIWNRAPLHLAAINNNIEALKVNIHLTLKKKVSKRKNFF